MRRSGYARKVVLIGENIVMRWSTGSEQPSMTLQIKVELRRVCNLPVDNGTRRAIPASVSVLGLLWEEPDMVALADHNHRNFRLDTEFGAGSLDGRKLCGI